MYHTVFYESRNSGEYSAVKEKSAGRSGVGRSRRFARFGGRESTEARIRGAGESHRVGVGASPSRPRRGAPMACLRERGRTSGVARRRVSKDAVRQTRYHVESVGRDGEGFAEPRIIRGAVKLALEDREAVSRFGSRGRRVWRPTPTSLGRIRRRFLRRYCEDFVEKGVGSLPDSRSERSEFIRRGLCGLRGRFRLRSAALRGRR
jgi:hypothetical protein